MEDNENRAVEKLDKLRELFTDCIYILTDLVVNKYDGYDEFAAEYKDVLRAVFSTLLEIREDVEKDPFMSHQME